MTKNDRIGKRVSRNFRKQVRKLELSYYLIVTDTEATERCYFTGLYQTLPKDIKDKIVIKVIETKTHNMIEKCLEMTAYEPQYRIPWIIFDRDQIPQFDDIINEAKKKEIQVGWSNPCFEIWMYTYFGLMPTQPSSWTCCSNFGKEFWNRTGYKYSKSDIKLYEKLYKYGDEKNGVKIARQKLSQLEKENLKPSEMNPCTTVHLLVEDIKKSFKE